jgi:hypothetical protein
MHTASLPDFTCRVPAGMLFSVYSTCCCSSALQVFSVNHSVPCATCCSACCIHCLELITCACVNAMRCHAFITPYRYCHLLPRVDSAFRLRNHAVPSYRWFVTVLYVLPVACCAFFLYCLPMRNYLLPCMPVCTLPCSHSTCCFSSCI